MVTKRDIGVGAFLLGGALSAFASGQKDSGDVIINNYSEPVIESQVVENEQERQNVSPIKTIDEVQLETNYGRNSGYQHFSVESKDYSGLEKLATFEYASNRPEPELNGKIHQYDFWTDGTISEVGRPNVRFANKYFWDIDGDGKFGKAEEDALDAGYLIWMNPKFDELADEQSMRVIYSLTAENEMLKNKIQSMIPAKNPSKRNLQGADKSIDKKVVPSEVVNIQDRLGLNVGGFYENDSTRGNFAGGEVGLAWDRFYDKLNLGVDVSGRVGFGDTDKQLSRIVTEPSGFGLYAEGTLTQASAELYQAAIDFKLGVNGFYGLLGADATWRNFNDRTDEKILRNDEVLKENTLYQNSSDFSVGARFGVGYVSPKTGLGVNAIYSTNFDDRNSVSGSLTIPLSSSTIRQKKKLDKTAERSK